MSAEQRIELSIDGMHCGGCVRRVTGALGGLEVEELQVEVGRASFLSEDEEILERARQAVTALGFQVKKVERRAP